MTKPDVITFGCRLNAYESEVIRRQAIDAGLDNTIVFNTCAVTAEATRQARQAIRRARRDHPTARIVVTGCAAQTDPDMFARMAEVDHVLGNDRKLDRAAYADFGLGRAERVTVNDIMAVTETAGHMIDGFAERARAFVQIQNGCDHRCTFCIIPYGRGNSRSVPMGVVVEQIRKLVAAGLNEVVLTGVDLTSYGADLPGKPGLGTLCRKILDLVPDLPRLRLSSIDSIEVDDTLMEVITTNPRLMPHLHLSLQAGDDLVLKRMKRRHSRDDAIAFCRAVRDKRPEVTFGADLIAGFPTETEEMFENTLRLVDQCDLTFLHVFPYSARKGTPAARMPQVPVKIRKERAARLRTKGAERRDRFLDAQIGKPARVLVEKVEGGQATGHSETFAPVEIHAQLAPGTIIDVTITGRSDTGLVGEVRAA
ncbi:MAG: tRNA (N(6)-L-threonylcarbamoyladenosine(37)-C(2))-methylthiotransferase MtaB [Alphaproteobacteria bacterium]|nr:MAG: tRNA (N(6)-L-threonylcarbamoyladenosine(37)-C(2))-methylthiotransferase MtaB [Alphaproteobacteria bacterium]